MVSSVIRSSGLGDRVSNYDDNNELAGGVTDEGGRLEEDEWPGLVKQKTSPLCARYEQL